jgi:hypothetical protein
MLSIPRRRFVLGSLACLLIAGHSAFGQLPGATGTYNAYDEDDYGVGYTQNVGSTTYVYWPDLNPAGVSGSYGALSLNFTTAPSLSATAVAVDSNNAGEILIAYDTMTYNFEVVYTGTGTATSTVSIDVAGNLLDVGQNNAEAGDAHVNVAADGIPGQFFGGEFGYADLSQANGSSQYDLQGAAYVGDPFTVYLSAEAGAAGPTNETESETASVDSQISIDTAGLADPSDYKIIFSPNLTPATVPDAVPTAGALVLALLALAALGHAGRFRPRSLAR